MRCELCLDKDEHVDFLCGFFSWMNKIYQYLPLPILFSTNQFYSEQTRSMATKVKRKIDASQPRKTLKKAIKIIFLLGKEGIKKYQSFSQLLYDMSLQNECVRIESNISESPLCVMSSETAIPRLTLENTLNSIGGFVTLFWDFLICFLKKVIFNCSI